MINWFNDLKNKNGLKFIVYDIESFYASINSTVLDKSLDWASTYVNITPLQRRIIHQACQSFLYSEEVPRVKRGNENFDVGMGTFNGAQICELVGLFMLSQLRRLPKFQTILYRDDGRSLAPPLGNKRNSDKK